MNSQELEFILKMRDEATAVLNRVGGGFDNAGKGSKRFSDENKRAAQSLTDVTRKAKEAAAAIGGVWAANKLAQGTIGTFASYERGMLQVKKTTDMASEAMVVFQGNFDNMARSMDGVSVDSMLEIAGAAGQLGVKGTQNLLEFTETMTKLQTASDVAGEEGAKSIARLLTITGDGIGQVKTFGSVLVGLGNNTAATEREILTMSATLAQSTAQFKIGATAIAGLGAAAAQLDMRPELFGTAVGRTLNRLTEAAQSGTKGMDMLTQATGLTQKQFQELIANDPTEAFLKFLSVLQALNADGQSLTGFLREFQLQGEESIRVLGTAGVNVDLFREKVKQAKEEAANPVALDREYEEFTKGLTAQWEGLKNAIKLVAKDIGASLGPALKSMVGIAKTAVNTIGTIFGALPDSVKPWVAAIALGAPAIKGLLTLLRLVAPAVAVAFGTTKIGAFMKVLANVGGWVLYLINPFKMLRLAIIAVVAFAEGFVGALVAGFGAIPVAIAGAVAAIALIGVALYKNWDAVKAFFSQSWSEIGSQLVDMIVNGFTTAMAKAKGIWDDFWSWATGDSIQQRAEEMNRGGGDVVKQMLDGMDKAAAAHPLEIDTKINTDGVKGLRGLSEANREALAQLDDVRKAREEIEKIQKAINQLKELPATSNDYRDQQEIARLEAQLELRKRQLDPVTERLRLMDIEIADAAAITAEERNRLEILAEIRSLEEQIGKLTEQQRAAIEQRTRALQEARKNTAFAEMKQELAEQLQSAQAITRAEKNRVAILQQLNQFERENGVLKAEQRKEVEALLAATQQTEQFNALRSSLDPQGEAIRAYKDDLATLRAEFDSGRLSAEEYGRMLAQLDRSTLSARDPFAAQIKSLNQQMELLRIGGDYKDADRKTQQTINQLTEQGVTLTKEQTSALAAANRELQDMEKAQSSGLQGWINSVGSLKDNLMDMTKDFASGLSDAISGALEGKSGNFTALARRIAANMISVGVNQTLKNILQGAQGSAEGIGSFFSKVFGGSSSPFGTAASTTDASKTVSEALQSMTTASMNVTAATVMINGAPLGVPGAGVPGVGGSAAFSAPVGKVTRQSLPEAFNPSSWGLRGSLDARGKSTLDTSGWDLRGAINVANDNISKAVPDAVQSAAGNFAKQISLTPKEILDLKKTLSTEWVTSAGEMQGKGIIDTILNRKASGKWGDSITDVVNARSQFSDINSILTDKKGRWTVDALPDSILNSKKGKVSSDLVDRWLAERAGGASSSVGDNLNYANPYYSSKSNLGWINNLDGPVYGSGKAIHRHGTTPELQRYRPGEFGLNLPGQTGVDPMATGSLPQVSQLTNQWQQQMATANATIAQQMPQAFQAPMQNVGQQFGQVFSQSGTALQGIAPQFQNIAQQAQSVVPQLGGFGQSLTGLMGPLMQAPAATGQFGSAIMQLIQQMGSGMGGGFGGVFGLLGGLFHKGGEVGSGTPASGMRVLPASAWANAPRFHKGLKSNEYTAILERGERVLTANDNSRNMNLIEGLSSRLEAQQRQSARNDRSRFGNGGNNFNQNITVYAEDANSFRRSEGQLMADSSVQMRRLAGRNS